MGLKMSRGGAVDSVDPTASNSTPRRSARRSVTALSTTALLAVGLWVGPGGALNSLLSTPSPLVATHLGTGTWSCASGTYFGYVKNQFMTASALPAWKNVGKAADALNALAYSPATKNVIGLDVTRGANFAKLVTVSPKGVQSVLGAIPGVATNVSWNAGDIDPSTGLYYISRGGNNLTVVNLATMRSSNVAMPDGFQIGLDLVIQRGWVWTVNKTTIDGFSLSSLATKQFTLPSTATGTGAGMLFAKPGTDTISFQWNNTGKIFTASGLSANSDLLTKVGSVKVLQNTSQDGTVCAPAVTAQPDNAPVLTVAGNLTYPLFPGMAEPVNLSLTNSYSTPVTMAAKTLRITVTNTSTTCHANANYSVRHGLTVQVVVPGNSTRTLSQLGVAQSAWPLIAMLDPAVNQDACQGTSLTLHYTWSYSG